MPRIKSRKALERYNEYNDLRRNLPHMTSQECEAWVKSGKGLREFLGVNRFIDKGWRMTKKGELKLK
jgi:hypothetical protein